ncbi:MAG: nifS [Chlamydiales bacterium]|jgi:cysteine desulfurase|nr:nifS [Chlamydiales bacterium]
MTPEIYLDYSSSMPVSDLALARMLPLFKDKWGVPSQPHLAGQEILPLIDRSLKEIYALLGAREEDDFVFTSSGAESINQVLFSTYYDVTRLTGRNHFLTLEVEEAPFIMASDHLKPLGANVTYLPVDEQGVLSLSALKGSLSPRTAICSLSLANGLLGSIQPAREISRLLKEKGVLFHLDVTHALGKVFLDLDDLQPDFVTFSGDLIGAPKGTGGLLIRAGRQLSPLILGSGELARMRAGPLNIPFLAALGAAASDCLERRDFMATEVARLKTLLEQRLMAELPGVTPLFKGGQRLPHISVMAFPGVFNEALLLALSRKGVFASIGGGSFQQLSLSLKACGMANPLRDTAIAFSLSYQTREADIHRAVELTRAAYLPLKKMSSTLSQEFSHG